jgi:hypothetical protein
MIKRQLEEITETYEAIKVPNALPRPIGMGRLPYSCSPVAVGPAVVWASALDTASLSLRFKISR